MAGKKRQKEGTIRDREAQLCAWFTQTGDQIQKIVDGLDIGWGRVQRWATARMPTIEGLHLDIACGYATFLAQLGWRFERARLVGLNIDFEGPHALAGTLLAEARVAARLVQADAQRLPFPPGCFDSVSSFLGLQDIEIGFGPEGTREAVAEATRVLRPGGVLVLLDEFPFERLEALLDGLPVLVIDRAQRAPDVRWNRDVAERAIMLYADGWAAQARLNDGTGTAQTRNEIYDRMRANMEHQLAEQECYIPFGPVRMVVARKRSVGTQSIQLALCGAPMA